MTTVHVPNASEESNDIKPEILSKFGFPATHESCQMVSVRLQELVDGILRQGMCVTNVQGFQIVEFSLLWQLIQNLKQTCIVHLLKSIDKKVVYITKQLVVEEKQRKRLHEQLLISKSLQGHQRRSISNLVLKIGGWTFWWKILCIIYS